MNRNNHLTTEKCKSLVNFCFLRQYTLFKITDSQILLNTKYIFFCFHPYHAGPKWSKKSLTYFVEYGEDLSHDQQDSIFQKALQFWSDVSALSFSTASSSSAADIKIR